jgi:hypothetical protein
MSQVVSLRLSDELSTELEKRAKSRGETIGVYIQGALKKLVENEAPSDSNENELNLRGRLDELINEVIRIRMSIFGIAQHAQDGAFIPLATLEKINASARELSPKTDYRTP